MKNKIIKCWLSILGSLSILITSSCGSDMKDIETSTTPPLERKWDISADNNELTIFFNVHYSDSCGLWIRFYDKNHVEPPHVITEEVSKKLQIQYEKELAIYAKFFGDKESNATIIPIYYRLEEVDSSGNVESLIKEKIVKISGAGGLFGGLLIDGLQLGEGRFHLYFNRYKLTIKTLKKIAVPENLQPIIAIYHSRLK